MVTFTPAASAWQSKALLVLPDKIGNRFGLPGPGGDRTELQTMSGKCRCPRCGAECSPMHQVEAIRSSSPSRQSKCALGSALQATNIKSASQLPVEYYFTGDLFDKYPPPADMVIHQADFAELKTELLGQKIGGKVPSKDQIEASECIEYLCDVLVEATACGARG